MADGIIGNSANYFGKCGAFLMGFLRVSLAVVEASLQGVMTKDSGMKSFVMMLSFSRGYP